MSSGEREMGEGMSDVRSSGVELEKRGVGDETESVTTRGKARGKVRRELRTQSGAHPRLFFRNQGTEHDRISCHMKQRM